MFSQAGSPFRKARRTRDERRKTIATGGYAGPAESENLNILNSDENSMINISPLRKVQHKGGEFKENEGVATIEEKERKESGENSNTELTMRRNARLTEDHKILQEADINVSVN